ncbi:MAG: hypothetical protein KDB90_10530 [Planctomycetes bacterium]|nr:hypothetical protein [Planctomycetota bacterium]
MAEDETKQLPSDEELAAMLSRADGKRTGKKPKRDPKLPSPRFPEALYYYLFILIEASILIGVWGFMRMGVDEALKGPSIEAPIIDQLVFHLKSIGIGLANVLAHQPWVPLGAAVLCVAVFVPTTPKSRKRMATIVSTVLVIVFVMLIALQFSDDIASAGAMQQF